MAEQPEFPKHLHHPHFRKGKITAISGKDAFSGKPFTDYQGEPDLFPDVTVNNGDQEAFYRAKGYLGTGERPPAPADYAEYPVMLSHPEHVDAIPDDFDIKRQPDGQVISTRIPGSPEKFPAVMVKSRPEEEVWEAKGYRRVGQADGDASQRAKASPYDPNFERHEYPKIVDGKIVDPHASVQHNRYPMYVGDTLVNSAEEEAAARGVRGPILPAGNCIICGEPFNAIDEWRNGAAGPLHVAHLSATAPSVSAENAKPKSAARQAAGRKSAETRARKKAREDRTTGAP